jgi:HEAT repeat protein
MTKHRIVAGLAITASLLRAADLSTEAPAVRAWTILQEGVANKSPLKRVDAIHSLRLLPNNTRAQQMAEKALSDSNPKVRAAAARTLGLMKAASSCPELKALLNDKVPTVVLAAAHALLLLGQPEEAYKIDFEVLVGDRKGAAGFVASQLDELKDSKAVAMMGVEAGIGFAPFGGPAYEVFKRVSKDNESPLRAAAAKELAADRDPNIDTALANASSDKKWPVRAAAVFAIAKREDPALLNVITPRLEDKNDSVRDDAAAAIVRLSAAKDVRDFSE